MAANGLQKNTMVLIGFAALIRVNRQVNPLVFTQNPKRSLPLYSPSSHERSSGIGKCHWCSKERLFQQLYLI